MNRSDTELDWIFPNKEVVFGDGIINGNLGCRGHEIVVFRIWNGVGKESSRM